MNISGAVTCSYCRRSTVALGSWCDRCGVRETGSADTCKRTPYVGDLSALTPCEPRPMAAIPWTWLGTRKW